MPAFVPRLNELCERAYAQNTIIVASRRNFGDMGYPAQFSSVIGVDREAYKDLLRVHFRPRDFIEFDAPAPISASWPQAAATPGRPARASPRRTSAASWRCSWKSTRT